MHIFNAIDTLDKGVYQMHKCKIMPNTKKKKKTYTDSSTKNDNYEMIPYVTCLLMVKIRGLIFSMFCFLSIFVVKCLCETHLNSFSLSLLAMGTPVCI